jgi:nitronate monooxygenase
VTTVLEAEMALARGAGALVAQGPSAAGHRGTFDPVAQPACQPLAVLLAALSARVDAPIVAAGGLATSVALQLGTAFRLVDESIAQSASVPSRKCPRDNGFSEVRVF